MHLHDRIWSTLQEDPTSHLEYIQWCNLYLAYLGSGIYVQLIPRAETVSFQIFSLPDLFEMDIETKPVAIGTLTSDKTETLNQVLMSGISAPTKTLPSATTTRTEYEAQQQHQTISADVHAQQTVSSTTLASTTITRAEYEEQQQCQTKSTNVQAQQKDSGKTTVTVTVHKQGPMTTPHIVDEYDDMA